MSRQTKNELGNDPCRQILGRMLLIPTFCYLQGDGLPYHTPGLSTWVTLSPGANIWRPVWLDAAKHPRYRTPPHRTVKGTADKMLWRRLSNKLRGDCLHPQGQELQSRAKGKVTDSRTFSFCHTLLSLVPELLQVPQTCWDTFPRASPGPS